MDLPDYLIHSDVCFQFYKPMRCNDTRNSQKLFLYFAAGKPVVSTPSADVESYEDIVRIANTAKEFVQCVEDAITNDRAEQETKLLAKAEANSWDRRVGKIIESLTGRS